MPNYDSLETRTEMVLLGSLQQTRMSWFSWKDPINLRDWAIDCIYRVDAGLYEIERKYAKKYKNRKPMTRMLNGDRTYNQLRGKFTLIASLMTDFKIAFPMTGDRIADRIKALGGKVKIKL